MRLKITFLPSAELIWGDGLVGRWDYAHCFVCYNGRYYDAECPEGVDDWEELPYFQRANSRRDAG